jgi:hypothetical protein
MNIQIIFVKIYISLVGYACNVQDLFKILVDGMYDARGRIIWEIWLLVVVS